MIARSPRPRASWLRRRLSYANVAATLALFLSLGGVSYAAISLPPESVGPAQLQAGAVTPDALGLALGAQASVEVRPHWIAGGCGHGGTGGVGVGCESLPPSTLAVTHITTSQPGLLLVSAVAGMGETEASEGSAPVTLTASLDGAPLPGQSSATVSDDSTAQVPYQSSARVDGGQHTVALKLRAADFDGQLRVEPVALSAVALPPAS